MAEPNLQEPPCRYGLRYVSLLLPISVNVPNALPSADYRVIDPRYGTLEDWDNLLNGVHERKMKLMSVLIYRFRATLYEQCQQDGPRRKPHIRRGEDVHFIA